MKKWGLTNPKTGRIIQNHKRQWRLRGKPLRRLLCFGKKYGTHGNMRNIFPKAVKEVVNVPIAKQS